MLDRSLATQALCKALAYASCGKPVEARQWATKLVRMLQSAGLV